MKLKQLLEQLNQLAKERPEALEMEVLISNYGEYDDCPVAYMEVNYSPKEIILH